MVCVERRGAGKSRNNSLRPGINPDGHDGHDVVEWIAAQPWSDGKIGMWGASNQGKIQYATAMTQPPHLVCIMPAETTPNTREYDNLGISYDQVYIGGVLRLELLQKAQRSKEGRAGQPGGVPDQISQHMLDDGFFDQRPEGAPTLLDVKVPIMSVGAWFDNDNNRVSINLFMRLQSETLEKMRPHHRLLIGPWIHTGVYTDEQQGELYFPGAAAYYQKREKQFYDYWLRGIQNGQDETPNFTWYQMGENAWQTSDTWPSENTGEKVWYLHPDGKLSADKPAGSGGSMKFTANPDNPVPTVGGMNKRSNYGKGPCDQREKVETHSDVLLYTSPVLDEDCNLQGDVKVQVFVSTDAEDTDVAFRLTDVFPDGRSLLLRDGILRMSLRNTRKAYEFLTPDQIYEGVIETFPVGYTIQKGHCLRLIISSSNYPRWDVNTNTRNKLGEAKAAHNKLYVDAEHPSALILTTGSK